MLSFLVGKQGVKNSKKETLKSAQNAIELTQAKRTTTMKDEKKKTSQNINNLVIESRKLCYSTHKKDIIKDYRESNKEDKHETI